MRKKFIWTATNRWGGKAPKENKVMTLNQTWDSMFHHLTVFYTLWCRHIIKRSIEVLYVSLDLSVCSICQVILCVCLSFLSLSLPSGCFGVFSTIWATPSFLPPIKLIRAAGSNCRFTEGNHRQVFWNFFLCHTRDRSWKSHICYCPALIFSTEKIKLLWMKTFAINALHHNLNFTWQTCQMIMHKRPKVHPWQKHNFQCMEMK